LEQFPKLVACGGPIIGHTKSNPQGQAILVLNSDHNLSHDIKS